jgi:hypothetical protein
MEIAVRIIGAARPIVSPEAGSTGTQRSSPDVSQAPQIPAPVRDRQEKIPSPGVGTVAASG